MGKQSKISWIKHSYKLHRKITCTLTVASMINREALATVHTVEIFTLVSGMSGNSPDF